MHLEKKGCVFPELFPLFKGPGRAHALFKGPGRAHMGLNGPIWAHISNLWFNFARFGFKIEFLMKILDDSAWFCMEKLKNLTNEDHNLQHNTKPKTIYNTPQNNTQNQQNNLSDYRLVF